MFNQVCIVGTGLLGGSLALELRQRNLCRRIVGVCRSESTAQQALEQNIVDQVLPLNDAVKNSDVVVLAVPMQGMMPIIRQLKLCLPKDCLLTDVGSVKRSLYGEVSTQCPELLPQFVFGHPIAGGESSGVASARLSLYDNKHVVITPTKEAKKNHIARISELWTQLGATVLEMSVEEHDAVFAKTSHLPHVIAFALVNFLHHDRNRERLFDLAAAGFYDFTRIASSDAVMWRDICVTNKDAVLEALDGFSNTLKGIRNHIADADQDQILDFFGDAREARNQGLLAKAEKMGKNRG